MKIIKISAMWCPSCIIVNKFWNDLKKEFSDIEFVDYDYDFDEEEVNKLEPGKILPVFIFYEDDLEVKRVVGEKKKEELYEIIKDVKTL